MIEEKLLKDLKELSINTSKSIAEYMNTYIVNYDGLLGVAVETKCNVNINEQFNNVSLVKVKIKREEATREVIFMYVNENNINNFFIKLCIAFLEDSELIATNPIVWYEGWKDILGNEKTEKTVYDIISELKVLCYLQKRGENPNLDAANKGTFDISSKKAFYEVKASKLKTKEVVTIHSQFQLDTKGLDRPLFIVYCKVEENDAGDSISSLYNELKANSYNMNTIDDYLNRLGYYCGSIDRNKKYIVHEIRAYVVDDKFPSINDRSFVNGKFPSNIIKIEYTISLDGLKYIKIL